MLDAQRSLYNAEIDETISMSEHITSLIRLYRALGGGWPTELEAPTAPPPVDNEPQETKP